MIHINQMVSELKMQPDEIRSCCALLNLALDGDKLNHETVNVLNNVKAVAEKANISFMQAAQQIADLKNAERNANRGGNRFDKREYIRKRFGQDPELAAPDSFIGLLYNDVRSQSEQLGKLRRQTILEASTLILHDLLINGMPESGDTAFQQANDRATGAISDFLGSVNWEVGFQLTGTPSTSTQHTKQLTTAIPASDPKMPASAKKSPDK